MGYLSESLINYLLLLGWSPGENQEIIDIDQAIQKFNIKDINKAASVFDTDKLKWLNTQYIRKYDSSELTELLIPRLIDAGLIKSENFNRKELLSVVELFKNRIFTLSDFINRAGFAFLDNIKFDNTAKERFFAADLSDQFHLLIERIDAISDFNPIAIEDQFRKLVKAFIRQGKRRFI